MAHSQPKFHVCQKLVYELIGTTPYTLTSYTVPETGMYEIIAHACFSSGSEGAITVGVMEILVGTDLILQLKETINGFDAECMSLVSGACLAEITAGSTIYQKVYTTKSEYAYIEGTTSQMFIRKLEFGRIES